MEEREVRMSKTSGRCAERRRQPLRRSVWRVRTKQEASKQASKQKATAKCDENPEGYSVLYLRSLPGYQTLLPGLGRILG